MRFLLFLLLFPFGLSGQVIPTERTVDWTVAGLQEDIPQPIQWLDVTDFGAVADGLTNDQPAVAAAIAALNGEPGGIFFPPGTYLLEDGIGLHSGVTVRGAGPEETELLFHHDTAGFSITGAPASGWIAAETNLHKGSGFMTIAAPSSLEPGDWAELLQDNGSWYLPEYQEDWADDAVGQMLEITGINDDTVFFRGALRTDFDLALNPRFREIEPVSGVSIECLKLHHIDSTAAHWRPNIDFLFATNCRVAGIESDRSIASHISGTSCSNLAITGNYIHHAYDYSGIGRQGYGISFDRHTGECLVENNIFQHLRHSMMVKVGANGNVFGYNYSIEPNRAEVFPEFSGDFSLHGHWPFANLFEGNIVQNIILDHFWGPSGPHNTLFRNEVEHWGIIFSESSVMPLQTASQNIVGNLITLEFADSAEAVLIEPFFDLYYGLLGPDHFEYGNVVDGVITPANTTALSESSYYLTGLPDFWTSALPYPSVGIPNVGIDNTIPARERYEAGTNLTVCPEAQPAVGLQSLPADNNVVLFPNPSNGRFTIRGLNGAVRIFDVQGRLMEIEPQVQANGSMSVEGLPTGLYVLVSHNNGAMVVEKIVVQ